nr:MAG TPA: Nuclease [Caudoviricetes sp.]
MNMRNAMRSEDTEQIAVIQWTQYNVNHHPELKWLHHVPNGGSRNRLEAVKLKQMGVKAGVADLCLPYPKGIYCGLYIEMKFGNNRQQDTQKEFLADMAAAGHFVATCYSAEEAISIITEYLNLKDATFGDSYAEFLEQFCNPEEVGRKMRIPNNSILKDGKVKGGAK